MFGIDVPALAARLGADNLWKTVQSFTQGLVVPKTAGTGIKVDTAAPTFGWADLLGAIDRAIAGSGAAPVWSSYVGGLYQYSFGTAGGITEVFVNFHAGHDLVPGTDWYIHAHWSTIAAPTGQCNWLFDVAYGSGYGRGIIEGTAGQSAYAILSAAGTPSALKSHMISETLLATPGGLLTPAGTFSITAGTATLTASQATWASTDVTRTGRIVGAGAAGSDLEVLIQTYVSPTQVTVQTNALTTVTAQTGAFKWRLLDSNLIEPDGLFIVRCWRDASRVADTLNVAPFLHFVDLHYQSNSVIGTKGRNYPFYT
jgi:hypothetical protein